ncbi:fungal specific transcription factor domain-containing protein [Rhodotorula paludigena]|uniref:fungal specific transcription factor domain-containing protein n=1 Tax=Rhodotorula paludigena TaxID=86838 RepID=UPI00317A70CF
MRCLPMEPSGVKCARCSRLALDCVWTTPQKRGRKPKTVRKSLPPPAPPPASAPTAPLSYGAAPSPLDILAASALPSFSAQPFSTASATLPALAPVATQAAAVRGPVIYDTPQYRSEASPSAYLSLVDVARTKEEVLSKLGSGGQAGAPPSVAGRLAPPAMPEVVPDAVDLHILSEQEAAQLFDHFHHVQNRFINLFDRHLHTLDFCRRTSTVLFSAILAVSAKFSRPDLYPALLANAKQLVGRGIVEARASVGLIQAILALVYWKEPMDQSAWVRIGIAIRMGLQLHLHAQRTTPLPENEHEARLIMNIERTWHILVAFDHTYNLHPGDEDDGFHQTFMIPHYRIDMVKWVEETRKYDVEDDRELVVSFEWVKVLRMTKDLAHSRPMQARALGIHLKGTLDATYQRYLDPKSPHCLNGNRVSTLRVAFFLHSAYCALNRALLISVGTNGVSLAQYMVSISCLASSFEDIAKEGLVKYWQDVVVVSLYGVAEFCVKIFPKVYPSNQTTILEFLERIYQACEVAAEGKEDSVAAFISRFFKLSIRVLCSPAPSAQMSTAYDHQNQAQQQQQQSAQSGLPQSLVDASPFSPAPGVSSALASTSLAPASLQSMALPGLDSPVMSVPPPDPVRLLSSPTSSHAVARASLTSRGMFPRLQGVAAFEPIDVGNTFASSMGDDRFFWESMFPGQASDWSWLDQPIEDLVVP